MEKVSTLGIDLAKNIFQLHAEDRRGKGAMKLSGLGGTEQHAAQGMRVGPSESVDRGRLQTTSQRRTLSRFPRACPGSLPPQLHSELT